MSVDDLTDVNDVDTTDEQRTPRTVKPAKKEGLAHRLYTGRISYGFIARRKTWYIFSAILLLVSIGALLLRGLNLGIEFTGGADFQAPITVAADTTANAVKAVQATGLPDMGDTSAVTLGDSTVRVQTRSLTPEEVTVVRTALSEFAGTSLDKVTYSSVGKTWGDQITQKGLQALIIFVILVMALIWAYFRDWKMAIAAIVALIHDLIVTVGIYALVGFSVTPASLIGLLTILGYSLYDTVVVFDKVRENVVDLPSKKRTYSEAANLAINQVLVRSLNTTIIGVLPVAALLFAGAFVLGTGPLEDLGLALFVGMIVGAYSSIFIATPLLAQMREREPEMIALRESLARAGGRRRPRPAAAVAPAAAGGVHAGAPIDAEIDSDATESDSVDEVIVSSSRRQPTRSNRRSRK